MIFFHCTLLFGNEIILIVMKWACKIRDFRSVKKLGPSLGLISFYIMVYGNLIIWSCLGAFYIEMFLVVY